MQRFGRRVEAQRMGQLAKNSISVVGPDPEALGCEPKPTTAVFQVPSADGYRLEVDLPAGRVTPAEFEARIERAQKAARMQAQPKPSPNFGIRVLPLSFFAYLHRRHGH